jgi:lipopolysaccharide transport system ATP-binding protein
MIVLSAESVAKRYRVRHASPETVRETSIRWLRGERHAREAVWALRDVSFDVAQGRALGVIGHNGAGKSTLLRALCGVTLPTSGRVVVRSGSVSGLLELGGGFHLDCTGRQNVMTAGLLNGLTAVEVRAREREIIAFAELEDVIDCPVRTYSSGMYLRLAFAVAVHFDPAILARRARRWSSHRTSRSRSSACATTCWCSTRAGW